VSAEPGNLGGIRRSLPGSLLIKPRARTDAGLALPGDTADAASTATLICGRWHFQGQYAGGMPAAAATPGSQVDFTGTDILRIDNGLLAEYWLNSDVHVMTAQLGMTT
jgi:hypothetical protein